MELVDPTDNIDRKDFIRTWKEGTFLALLKLPHINISEFTQKEKTRVNCNVLTLSRSQDELGGVHFHMNLHITNLWKL